MVNAVNFHGICFSTTPSFKLEVSAISVVPAIFININLLKIKILYELAS